MNTKRRTAPKPKNPRRISVNEVESEDERSAETSEEQSHESPPPNRPPSPLPGPRADAPQPVAARAQTAARVGEGDDPVVTPPPPQLKTKRDKVSIFKKKAAAPAVPRPLESLDPTSLKVNNAQYKKSIKVPPPDDNLSPITIAVKIGSKSYVVKARTVDLSDHVLNTNLIRALGLSGVTAPATAELTVPVSLTLIGALTKSKMPIPGFDELKEALGPQSPSPSQISEMAPGSTIEQIERNPKNLAAFQKWANSEKGVSALGSMAFVDLLVGMDDRVMTKWNGANFMFNSKEGSLSCIDNAKNSTLGLLNDNQDAAWQNFVTTNLDDREGSKETIPQAIARLLYRGDSGTPLGPRSMGPPQPVDPGKVAQIRQVAHDAFQQVSGELANVALPPAVAIRLQARLSFLQPLLNTAPH